MFTPGEQSMFTALELLAAETGHHDCAGIVVRRNDAPAGKPVTFKMHKHTIFGVREIHAVFDTPWHRAAYGFCTCGAVLISAN